MGDCIMRFGGGKGGNVTKERSVGRRVGSGAYG